MTVIPEARADLLRAVARGRTRRRRLGIAIALTSTLAASGTAMAATGWNPLTDELVAQPTVDFRHAGPQHPPRTVRQAGEAIAARIPTPPGHPIDVDWNASRGDNTAGMRAVAEYNAACQWYAYALQTPPSQSTLRTIATIPRWPSFRGTFKNPVAFAIAQDLQAGATASTRKHLDLNCR